MTSIRTQINCLAIVYSSLSILGCDQIATRLRDAGVDKTATSYTSTPENRKIDFKEGESYRESKDQAKHESSEISSHPFESASNHRPTLDKPVDSQNTAVNDSVNVNSGSPYSVESLVKEHVSLFEKIKGLTREEKPKGMD
jgi:hypothetical protein